MAVTDSLLATIVRGDVFSATRQAPRSRFVVPGQPDPSDAAAMAGTAMAGTAMAGTAMAGTAKAGTATSSGDAAVADTSGDAMPRVFGIITMSGERRALLQLAPSDAVPRLYRAGDAHAGYRVVRVEADRVILSSSTGSRTLRLSSRATPDSLENLP